MNPAFEMVTGYRADEVFGKNPNILQSGIHNREFYQEMWKEIRETGSWQGEIWNKRKSGEIFPKWITVSSIKDSKGN